MGKSEDQHARDLEKFREFHGQGSCLNRHVSPYTHGNACSHRWQAHERAKDEDAGKGEGARRYDWPAYRSLSSQVRTRSFFMEVLQTMKLSQKPPEPGEWDLGLAPNFLVQCSVPYWHEAHHVVPNSTLRTGIENVGKGSPVEQETNDVVRGGLLKEGYNLNRKNNLILLPMDRRVAISLGLPRHRLTRWLRSHGAYSDYVRGEVKEIFAKMTEDVREHQKAPGYTKSRRQLERLSARLYSNILDAGRDMQMRGGGALDDMSKAQLDRGVGR